MHYPTIDNPIDLVHRENGIIFRFTNIDHLLIWWPTIRRYNIGPSFKVDWERDEYLRVSSQYYWNHWLNNSLPAWPPGYHYYEYILRDSFGDTFDPKTISSLWHDTRRARKKKAVSWGGKLNRYYPGRKRRHCHQFRNPRTTQERRWATAWDDEEFAPKVRARRKGRYLPDSWDDVPRSDWEHDRSWKNYRKHQWKEKNK